MRWTGRYLCGLRARQAELLTRQDQARVGSNYGVVRLVDFTPVFATAEMVDALVATRAYEANLGAMELSKNMAQQSLRILG